MKGNFSSLIKTETPTLIDFYADWCQPCKMMSPILQEVAKHYGSKLKVLKINVDKHQNLAMQYRIQGVPTMILFKNGNILWRQSGAINKSQLISILDTKI